ncbi:RNI-like superfamily protein [Tasmannia lanceolata]|uniref:RNI-like superfamily protein n=1 Tax=Tasmannia lanceolata TaxID=3420 RepID=UPI0040646931
MEKGKSTASITSSLKRLHLNSVSITLPSYRSPLEKVKPRSLVSLCLRVLGQHFEDIIDDLSEIVATFPPDIKMALTAIARRRKLLNDDILITLAENSWDILDISGSDVTDFGLGKVADMCQHLRAIDISRCGKITALGVSELLSHCPSLEILRWGGCIRSDFTARSCLSILKPKLNAVEEESWEELDSMDIVNGAHSLRWLVWPKIDDYSMESLATECPRILVNPKPSPFGFRGVLVPHEALPDVVLDDTIVKDIDPKTWEVRVLAPRGAIPSISDAPELPMAERFRLAFVERDARLAPKRAKNARQHRRRAEREWVMTSTDAKSIALASQAAKLLNNRS